MSENDPAGGSDEARDRAIIKLLGDDDSNVVHLVVSQLIQRARGGADLREIDVLLAKSRGQARQVLEGVAEHLRTWIRTRELREACGTIDTLAELEDFCWKFALWNDPDADVRGSMEFIDRCAETVRSRLTRAASAFDQIDVLTSVLHREEGLAGNAEDYYDPNNSFLDAVVLSRQGIPVTLTVIYMMVAARAGLKVEGIGMPEHFLARIDRAYFDPFDGGRVVTQAELDQRLEGRPPPVVEALLHPLPYRLIVQRMVRNLVFAFERIEHHERVEQLREILTWTD